MFQINNLTAGINGKNIISDIDLEVRPGRLHVLMGPNGSGKSTLAQTLMGHPGIQVASTSKIVLDQVNLLTLTPNDRAAAGLYLGFQTPLSIPGVSVYQFLKTAYEATHCADCTDHQRPCPRLSVSEFRHQVDARATTVDLPHDLLVRSINDGFSGGEKKRMEMLQLLVLKPRYAILDEPDSGLDIDSIKLVAEGIQTTLTDFHTGILLITHYQRILEYVHPDAVSVMVDGRIVATGNASLIGQIDKHGYQQFK